MLLVHKTVEEFVNGVESNEPAPGGGSVAALGGSLGAALTAMVGNLSIGKKTYEQLTEAQQKEMNIQFKKVVQLKEKLNHLIDEDTNAFNEVMGAFKLPKETEEEKALRKEAIQKATKVALEVPLLAATESLNVLKTQKIFAEYGNINAITDIGVGALMAYAGLEGALFNVEINLQGIKDEAYVKSVREECDILIKTGKALKEEVLETVYKKLGK
ncbi:Formiminotransferase-cyclodeaminase [Alkaliphilus metalliredigens QYMF]|uniref:Formiminotransferase-cyclodeaminase n=1 Tax=Alkaliphilus metalliredigens (strain QYMF) TaxID=293826 RepID=A6TWU2_ALKMQ|nr:cyclodeaminase/cyclohydrolase family protein [Alkaliphilus metalliredigens]ABR50660.1 Formiminotransferase-cyclodeaminase [Alkaliphilus metalliredigens QYMF]